MSVQDELVGVILPASAWLSVFCAYVEWLAADGYEDLVGDGLSRRDAIHLTCGHARILFAAMEKGVSATLDDSVTEARRYLEAAMTRLGYDWTQDDMDLILQEAVKVVRA